jgi:hypothetical protein
MVHMPTAQAPMAHAGRPLAVRHEVPQAPHAATLLCVSTQAPSQHDEPAGQADVALQPGAHIEPRQRLPGGQ